MIPAGIMSTGGTPIFTHLANVDNVQLAAGVTTYTSTARSIGTAASDRIVIVSTSFSSGAFGGNISATGVTCNGSAMTAVRTPSASANTDVNLWYMLVASGTTANFVVTVNGSVDERAGVVGFSRITGYSTTAPTITDTAAINNEDVALSTGDTIVSVSSSRVTGSYIYNTSSMDLTIDYNTSPVIGTDSHEAVGLLAHLANVSSGTYRSTPADISYDTATQHVYAVWR